MPLVDVEKVPDFARNFSNIGDVGDVWLARMSLFTHTYINLLLTSECNYDDSIALI